MPKQLDGKVALVTGAGSGIGRECALEFARRGASIVVADTAIDEGEETVFLATQEDTPSSFFIETDTTDTTQVVRMVQTTVQKYGRLDFACNAAAIEGADNLVAECDEQEWRRVIDVNLIGAWLAMKHEIDQMLKQDSGGSIVNLSSIFGKVAFPSASAFVASQHGLIGLTKTAAIEYANRSIRINAVCPAFIHTPHLEQAGASLNSETYQMLMDLHPMKRLGTPTEVAEAVVWLCSEAASFITGTALLVDGGYVAQ